MIYRIHDNGTDREMTASELAEYQAYSAAVEAEAAQLEAEKAAKESARQTAIAKLEAIGLTPADIAALLG
jgi:hypothetical protein